MAVRPAWMPAGLGASPKKLAILGALVAALGYTAWTNLRSDDSSPVAASTTTVPQSVPALKRLPNPAADAASASASSTSDPMPARRTPSRDSGRTVEDFHPSLKLKEDMDVSKIDPTLRTGLLERVRQVAMEGGSRNLFEFSKPPEPPAPKLTIAPGPVPPPVAAKPVPVEPPKPAGPPPPPPIPLKYFGYSGVAGSSSDGKLRGLFLEGDPNTGEHYLAGENEMIKGRYKVLRIGIKSAELQDTTDGHQQTLTLVEEQSQ